jgi:hypothetical protein
MMPLFHVETKFVMDEEKSSQLRLGLRILGWSKYFGFILVFIGLFIIAFRKIRYYCCAYKKINLNENPQKEVKELNPLVMYKNNI